jgi:DNA-binding XRE family transcriptional regulator
MTMLKGGFEWDDGGFEPEDETPEPAPECLAPPSGIRLSPPADPAEDHGAKPMTAHGAKPMTLRGVRQAMGKTQAQVAVALGTDQGEISRIERREDVRLSTLRRYAEVVGARCEVVFVFDGTGERVRLVTRTAPSTPGSAAVSSRSGGSRG